MLRNKWSDASLQVKMILSVSLTLLIILGMNLFMFTGINRMMERVDAVFSSNAELNDVSGALENVQVSVKNYLDTKSSDSLDAYYRADQEYRDLLVNLNDKKIGDSLSMAEKNICEQSETYLDLALETVVAKRGRNVEKYRNGYESCTAVYNDIQNCIYSLNSKRFEYNSDSYLELVSSLRSMELFSTVVLVAIGVINLIAVFLLTGAITAPLISLSKAANEVATGNFEVEIDDPGTGDEVGVVSRAFQTMVSSVQEYIVVLKNSMERESQMKAKELIMESRMKETELRTLQAQINPHFLFNTLNAGAQLAMMEDAEKTGEFIQNMADFFRYNIKKMNQDTTLGEEIQMVDNYIYIMNVRFAGEIHYDRTVDNRVLQARVPSMILQPIVENALNYGIRGLEREGRITLSVAQEGDLVLVSIKDNGVGMSPEKIERVLSGNSGSEISEGGNGIGLGNVIERLRLFTGRNDVLEIISEGPDLGTEFIIKVPLHI